MVKVVITYSMEVPQGKKKVSVIGDVTAFGGTCMKAFEAGMISLGAVEQECGGFVRSMMMSYSETTIEINR
jgi:hypothetical protein